MKTDSPSARAARRSAGLQSVLNLLLVFVILLMVNYLGFKKYDRVDLSYSQLYTLSPKTVDLLKGLDAPLTIYTYLDSRVPAQSDQITKLLKEYQRIGGKNVDLEKIDPVYDAARAAALQKELQFDGNDYLVIFKYKKDQAPRFVKQSDLYETNPMTQDVSAFKGEQQFTSTIISLIEGKTSRVYFITGHGEHSGMDVSTKDGYGFVSQALKNDNIEAAALNLAQKGDVPSDADAVVIAGPHISLSPFEIDVLDKYLANNGKLFILVDPFYISGLDGVLKKYGIKFDDDVVMYRAVTSTGASMTLPLAAIYQGGFSAHPITTKFAQAGLQLLIQNARSVSVLPEAARDATPKTQFLLQTDPSAWGWVSKDSAPPADPRQLVYNKATDIPGPVTIAVAYDGGSITDPVTKATITSTRVVAVGNSNFVDNDTFDGAVGANFFSNSLNWLVKKNAVLDINPKKPQEYGLSLSPMQFRTVIWCALVVVPGAAFALGLFTWFSRRK